MDTNNQPHRHSQCILLKGVVVLRKSTVAFLWITFSYNTGCKRCETEDLKRKYPCLEDDDVKKEVAVWKVCASAEENGSKCRKVDIDGDVEDILKFNPSVDLLFGRVKVTF